MQLNNITEQATWLKKATLYMGSFVDLFDFNWFGSQKPEENDQVKNCEPEVVAYGYHRD